MAVQVQFRRGTKAQHDAFTGATGEVTVNTTDKTLVMHDGTTQGGFNLARADGENLDLSGLAGVTTVTSVAIHGGTVNNTTIGIGTSANGNFTNLNVVDGQVGSALSVGAATTFKELLVVNGDARVTGILTIGTNTVVIDGDSNLVTIGNQTLSGDGDINSAGIGTFNTIDVTTADISNLFAVTGVVTTLTATDLNVTADARVGSALTVSGDLLVVGNLTVEGTETIINVDRLDVQDKTIGVASTSTASNTTANGAGFFVHGGGDGDKEILWQNDTGAFEVNQDWLPSADGTYDLGASGQEWQDLYVDGTANIDSLVADTADINAGTIDGTTIGGSSAAEGTFTNLTAADANITADARVGAALTVTGAATFQGNVNLGDNDRLRLGDGNDLQIYHNGTDSTIDDQGTGNLQLITNGSAIKFYKSGGEALATFNTDGAVELYNNGSKKFETTAYGVDVTGTTGTDNLAVSGVSTFTGTIDVDGQAIFDDITVSAASTFAGDATFQGNVNLGDDDNLHLGDNNDLRISHLAGGDSVITETGSGMLYLGANRVRIADGYSTDLMAQFNNGGSVDLYHNHVKKFETTAYGVDVTGTTGTDNLAVSGVSTFTGAIDANGGATIDNIQIGVSGDNEIDTSTGNLTIDSAGGTTTIDDDLVVSGNVTSDIFVGVASTATRIKDVDSSPSGIGYVLMGNDYTSNFNGGIQVQTNSSAVYVSHSSNTLVAGNVSSNGTLYSGTDLTVTRNAKVSGVSTFTGNAEFQGNVNLGDNDKLRFGNSQDLRIYHDSSVGASFIDDAGTGNLNIRASNLSLQKYTGEAYLQGIADGAVTIYYDAAARLATTDYGVEVTGTTDTDGLIVSGVTTTTGTLDANGNVTVAGTLDVDGQGIFDDITVSAASTFVGNVIAQGNVTINGDLIVEGTQTIINVDQLDVQDKTIGVASTSTASNTTANGGGFFVHGGADGDKEILWQSDTASFEVNQSWLPSADDSYDLGASAQEWRNLYLDGTANIDSLVADTADINGGTIDGTTIGGSTPAAGTFTDLKGGNVQVGTTGDNEIDTSTGNLTIDSAGGTTTIDDDLVVSGTVTSDTFVGVASTATRIKDIDTSPSGLGYLLMGNDYTSNFNGGVRVQTDASNLYFSHSSNTLIVGNVSSNGTLYSGTDLTVTRNAKVSGVSTFTGNATFTGLLDANGGATIDNVRIGVAGNNEIDTSTGNLTIDSAGGTTTVDDNLTVSSNLVVNGNVDLGNGTGDTITATGRFDSDIIPSSDSARDLGSTSLRWAEVWSDQVVADNIQIGVTGTNEIDTSSGNLTIDSAGGTTTIDDNLVVSGNVTSDIFVGVASTATRIKDIDLPSSGTGYVMMGNDYTANFNGGVQLQSSFGLYFSHSSNTLIAGNVQSNGYLYAGTDLTVAGVTTSTGGFVGDLTGNATTATTATNANNINVADESSDTTCNVVFTTGATGNLAPKTGTNLTFNSANGTLSATTFSGSGASLTSVNAATLDGIDSSSFLRSDTVDTKTSGQLRFNDNVEAVFGNGADLSIQHTGGHSIIADNGTGDLQLRGTNLALMDGSGYNFVYCTDSGTGGTVTLYHSNSAKLSTKSDGIDVTGEVQCDSLDVDGGGDISNNLTVQGILLADQLRCRTAQQLVLNAGESSNYTTGQTGEHVYVNAESGLEINSSPDNWSSGWAGRNTATICASNGTSTFPSTVSATQFNATSDIKLKENVTTIENGLDKISQLRGVEFDFKSDGKHSLGVIAQEVEEVLPDLVDEMEDGTKTVAYANLTAVLIEAVKELKAEVAELRSRLDG